MDQSSLVKRNFHGRFVSSRQKEMIINSYKMKLQQNPNKMIRQMRSTLSKELGIGETTISNTIAQYRNNKTVSSPNKTKIFKNITLKIDDFDKYAIRRKIHQFWTNRELSTLDKIPTVINEDKTLPDFSRSFLYRLLKSMEFDYCKQVRNSALLERGEIILWRKKYLRDIKKYRERGPPIYFLDETWVNAGGVSYRVWCDKTVQSLHDARSQSLSTGPVYPFGKGKRLIVVHIESEDGFVPSGLLCFESKKTAKITMTR
ncbi:uncharacterized protein LOC112598617 [Melanaphis sacchari]|uniref:uncharacterized protein LOC112598617 n=1 Tax=Melanaphis sacchari TaxID=742174 RepID=UPI000DC1380E|nr:uncharacterized protein LOC112598617 [Melanaphis sacchari]